MWSLVNGISSGMACAALCLAGAWRAVSGVPGKAALPAACRNAMRGHSAAHGRTLSAARYAAHRSLSDAWRPAGGRTYHRVRPSVTIP